MTLDRTPHSVLPLDEEIFGIKSLSEGLEVGLLSRSLSMEQQ